MLKVLLNLKTQLNKNMKEKEYQIVKEGVLMGTIVLPKKSFKIISDMLWIYCKYELLTLAEL